MPVAARAQVFIPPRRARVAVISDIDDTVMHTGVANKLVMLWRLFVEDAESRVAFPGVATLYRALHAGGTGADYVPRMLAALGAEIRPANGSWADLAARFRVGEIDAIAVAAGVPFPAIADLEARRAIRYIPITRDQVARIRLVAPELSASSIPAGTYPSLLTPYETVGLFNIAIARQDMVPSLAFEIVRDVFEFHAEMMEAHPAAAATVPANFVRNTVLPWHPGAMRYYGSRAVTGVLTGD